MLTQSQKSVLVLVNITVRRYWISLLKIVPIVLKKKGRHGYGANGGLRCWRRNFQSMALDSIVMIEQWEEHRAS